MSGVGGTGVSARRKLGTGEPGGWGVVGHGGVTGESVPPNTELVEIRGSNIEVVNVVRL